MNRSVLDWPTGVTVYHPDRCYNGYTLVHGRGPWDPVRGISAEQVDRWHLIDMEGQVVHEFYGNPATQRGSQLFERVANGHYISNGNSIIEQDWDGNIVWSLSSDFRVDARPTGFHHDIQKTSEHTYLAMVADRVDAPQVSRVTLKDDHIMEITSEGEIVWEWWGHHHLEEFGFSDRAKQIIFETGGGQQPGQVGDWLHLNTLHTLPDNPLYDQGDTRFKPGNILSCSRNGNQIFIIEKSTGNIVWKWGYLDQMETMWLNGTERQNQYLVGPHDPKMLHNGNILIYDNGGGTGYPPINRFYTRLVEINPVSGEVVWEYAAGPQASKFLSIVTGGVQRLPNGNTLSLDTDKGRIFEVTWEGEIVWEYINPRGGFYRTQRIAYPDCPLDPPDLKSADLPVPDHLGLPVSNTLDYCPSS